MNETPDDTTASGENADYQLRRRELMKKLAAGAVATPAMLSSVTARATPLSTFSPPPG